MLYVHKTFHSGINIPMSGFRYAASLVGRDSESSNNNGCSWRPELENNADKSSNGEWCINIVIVHSARDLCSVSMLHCLAEAVHERRIRMSVVSGVLACAHSSMHARNVAQTRFAAQHVCDMPAAHCSV